MYRSEVRPHRRLAAALDAYWRSERGASASEYALMLMVLAGCGVILLHALGRHMNGVFNHLASAMATG
ncbi:MAG: Flp family type IVb pilin [Caulobacteraceae bacterium]